MKQASAPSTIAKARLDLSQWVIHFVHQPNPENDPLIYDGRGDGEEIPLHTDPTKASRFDFWKVKAEEQGSCLDDAQAVLLRILDDGHIRCGWAMRKGRATIYGPRPACCFTEMPLYALLNYASVRNDSQAVDVYGVALLKSELFTAGGRPVIYGLSGEHRECGDINWPRRLDPSCGLAEHEQYRYVAMNLRPDRPIDWSHEREWRWADTEDKFDCPGLPVWLERGRVSFSTIVLIVPTAREAETVLDKLKLMRDSKSDLYGNLYSRATILRTRVLAIEELHLHAKTLSGKTVRIEDIPVHALKEALAPAPSNDLIAKVALAIKRAKAAADEAAKRWRSQARLDVYGIAYLMVDGPRTEIVVTMLQLKEINEIACSDGVGYRMTSVGGNYETGLLGEAEAAVEAGLEVLEAELPDAHFYVRTVWD